MPERSINRRQFGRLLVGGGAGLVPFASAWAYEAGERDVSPGPLHPAVDPDEAYWSDVRDRFLVPREYVPLNAANLCPASRPVVERLEALARDIDRDPSPQNRRRVAAGRERTRHTLAEFLHVSADEILITRNTSEANNILSSGLDLGPGDEVLVFADNHPSNLAAWIAKGQRAGFSVRQLDVVLPHPGPEHYVEAFADAVTPNTRLLGFSHVTNTVGDLFPAADLCRAARAKDVLTLVDGAQSFGVLDVDLTAMQADFYSGSAHKWPCGPREAGVLFVHRDVQARLAPSIVSLYGGQVGLSRTHEAMGQRDNEAVVAFGDALRFQLAVGTAAIERRVRELTQRLQQGLRRIDGVEVWTSPEPARSAGVVTAVPGRRDPRDLATTLYERHGIIVAARGGEDRPGIRFSPHFYNLTEEIDRTVEIVGAYVTG